MELSNLIEWLLAVITLAGIAGATMDRLVKPILYRIRDVWLTKTTPDGEKQVWNDFHSAVVQGCALVVALWEARFAVDVLDPWSNLYGVTDLNVSLLGAVDLTLLVQLLPAAMLSAFFGKHLHDAVKWLKGRATAPTPTN